VGCAEEEDGIRGVGLVAADYACCRPLIEVWILQDVRRLRVALCADNQTSTSLCMNHGTVVNQSPHRKPHRS